MLDRPDPLGRTAASGRNAPLDELVPSDLSRHPPMVADIYKTSVFRGPRMPLLSIDNTLSELSGPVFGPGEVGPLDNDLYRNFSQNGGEPIGPRIVVHGRLLDGNARPVAGALVEMWQANASGRYRHVNDRFEAPIDPNFGGCGRCQTDAEGRWFFRTVKPGAYPFRNRLNSWRPAHLHFSVFGRSFAQRLITQMYFEGDPLIPHDSILGTVPDAAARERLVARLDLNAAVPLHTLAYRWDIVLRGTRSTLFENRLEGN